MTELTSDVPPITMAVMGGLGNQLFQLATGLEVAKRAQAPLQLDLAWYSQRWRRSAGLTLRPFELSSIAGDIPFAPLPKSEGAAVVRHARDVILRRSPGLALGPLSKFVYETRSAFDSSILRSRPGTHLSGYFASWRYFPTVANDVRTRIRGAAAGLAWCEEWSAAAQRDRPIAIHVRRGDYVTLSETYGHLTQAYYARAIRVLRKCGYSGPIWLFSDEPQEARRWLAEAVTPECVIQPPVEAQSLESLVVMSQASAVVVANSTFSWWSAFLGDTEDRMVIAPRPAWAQEGMPDSRDALLPAWLTIDCRDDGARGQ